MKWGGGKKRVGESTKSNPRFLNSYCLQQLGTSPLRRGAAQAQGEAQRAEFLPCPSPFQLGSVLSSQHPPWLGALPLGYFTSWFE